MPGRFAGREGLLCLKNILQQHPCRGQEREWIWKGGVDEGVDCVGLGVTAVDANGNANHRRGCYAATHDHVPVLARSEDKSH